MYERVANIPSTNHLRECHSSRQGQLVHRRERELRPSSLTKSHENSVRIQALRKRKATEGAVAVWRGQVCGIYVRRHSGLWRGESGCVGS